MIPHLRLGVNIDHVATIRNARGGNHPDVLRAALMAERAGADGITAHLREDRRHISDEDIFILKDNISLPLNLEMAATPEMLKIALKTKPHACCIVPEKRRELTTEGGLDVVKGKLGLAKIVDKLRSNGSRVSLFIDPNLKQVDAAKELRADIVEFHTGRYCEVVGDQRQTELKKIIKAVEHAYSLGLECHAGHGLNFDTVYDIAFVPEIVELNIGHFLIGEAIFTGLDKAIGKIRDIMNNARNKKLAEIIEKEKQERNK